MRVAIRKYGGRLGALVAMTWIGCGGSASDGGASALSGDSGHDGSVVPGDGGAPHEGGSEASESGQADCGPDPGNIDCEGPCGFGLESPICIGGHWTCDNSAYEPLEMPCSCLRDAWQVFVSNHRSCTESNQCRVVGGAGSCHCSPSLGEGSGDAISSDPQHRVGAFLERFEQCKVEAPGTVGSVCDAAPARNVRCENGECVADSPSCLPLDAGANDGGSAD